jgi:hypothetical protein
MGKNIKRRNKMDLEKQIKKILEDMSAGFYGIDEAVGQILQLIGE